MGLLDKLFGRKKTPPAAPAAPAPSSAADKPAEAASDPSKDPNMIRVFDAYGRELYITRQAWRDDVLAGNIRKVWDQPDELYGMILSALQDGFRADVVDAAKHLHDIDPDPMRSACIWGIVLMEENRLDEAEKVLRNHISRHGESGIILTNLAKVSDRRNNPGKADEILWHALELDPNQDNAVGWYAVTHRERGGAEAEIAALRRIAAIPGSWRPQCWLARAALQSRDLESALALYREGLARMTHPIPGDLLMQISGDLGNAGHLPEILQLVAPHFRAATHGLQVGNNLMKAHLDLGQMDEAYRILEELYALKRPDWKDTLAYWDAEIAKARLGVQPQPKAEELQYAMISISGPIWLKSTSPAHTLYPPQESGRQLISFLGSSTEKAEAAQQVEHQMADASGRLSRALPLFLAEQVELGSDAATQTLIPWMTRPTQGFVVFGGALDDENAAQYSRMGDSKSDYVVVTHLVASSDPWTARLRLIRSIDGKCLGEISVRFPIADPGDAIRKFSRDMMQLLAASAQVIPRPLPTPPLYVLPEGNGFPDYLLRLEQLLVVRCAAPANAEENDDEGAESDGIKSGFLHGEREIVDGTIRLCLATPDSVSTRLLLVQTLLGMKMLRPDILPEFQTKLASLEKDHPLPTRYQEVIAGMLAEVI